MERCERVWLLSGLQGRLWHTRGLRWCAGQTSVLDSDDPVRGGCRWSQDHDPEASVLVAYDPRQSMKQISSPSEELDDMGWVWTWSEFKSKLYFSRPLIPVHNPSSVRISSLWRINFEMSTWGNLQITRVSLLQRECLFPTVNGECGWSRK